MTELKHLTPLMKRGSEFLNVKYPILCGAMTWVSEPKLVAAVCNSGCFGCLAGGNAPVEVLRSQIQELRTLTDKPFAVNLITIAPAYLDHLALMAEMKVPYIGESHGCESAVFCLHHLHCGTYDQVRRGCHHSGRQ